MERLTVLVCVKLSEKKVKKMEDLIEKEKFYSKSDILRQALNELLSKYEEKSILA
jgi:Arc/MetJ-type ribon-helix-helix transcriptional regulator